ncbi:MAG: hypothetical protein KJO69_05200 [Gammaproteobacteria bacterium]|nr:hypothetical protein [Gammaproteobacteria bacterium]NNJ73491.1 hypothetical protein [Enterobacterales bacterium]
MSEQAKKKPLLTLFLVGLCLLLGLPALYYFTNSQLVDFDPDAKLLDAAIDQNFKSELKMALQQKFGDVNGTAFHFTQAGCFCHLVAENHVSQVKNQISSEGHKNVQVALEDYPELVRFLPSTPAVIIFNDAGNFMYLGPYSTGYLCMPGNGLVEELIPRMSKNTGDEVVMSLANGCYCQID